MNIEDHPTVKRMRAIADARVDNEKSGIDAAWLRQLTRDCGADDVGLVEIDRPVLDSQRDGLLHHYLGPGHCWASSSHEPGADPQPGALSPTSSFTIRA